MKILIGVVFIILLCCHPVLANQLRQPATLLDITLSQLNHLSFQGEYERQRKLNSSTEKPEPDEFGLVEKFTLFKRDRNFKVNINVILESTAANMTRALCEKKSLPS